MTTSDLGIFAKRTSSGRTRLGMQIALLLSPVVAGTSLAQEQAAPAPEGRAQQGVIEEIIVTARKRVETMQEVPATVGVVSQVALSNTGSATLLQLASVAPGINLAKAPTGSQVGVTIRGLGSYPGVPSFDSSVSLFVDGVYAPRSVEFANAMFDVERIEVIRGTQAALLGKNTSLGAINLVTRKPGDRFTADLRGSYEFERGSTLFTGGVDIPVSDQFAMRISGQLSDDEGWTHNVIKDNHAPRSEDNAIRGVFVWNPTETLDITALVQHGTGRNEGSPVEQIASTGINEILAALAGYPGTIETRLDGENAITTPSEKGNEQWEDLEFNKYVLTADLTLGEHTLTSITAYSDYTDENVSDVDVVPGDWSTRRVDEEGKQFSQEIRLVSPADKAFDYIVGALYLKGELDNTTIITANYPFGPVPGVNLAGSQQTNFVQDNEAMSVFAQGNYKVSDAFRLTAGVRWTKEDKDVDLGRDVLVPGLFSLVVFPPYPAFSMDRSEDNVDYSFGVQYDVNDNAMVYASYGKGTKGGGYAQSVTHLDTAEYDKETAKTAEIGLKLQGSDRNWLFNIAAFGTDVDGFQLVTFDGIQFVVGNTDLSSQGFEVEGYWYVIPSLKLFVNNTYADAEDRHTHDPIPLAPKWTGSAGFNFARPLGASLEFRLDGAVDYRSERYYQQTPNISPPGDGFSSINVGMAVGAQDNRWEVRLIGRNLADDVAGAFGYPTPFLPAGNQSAVNERGRTVALQLSANF